MNKHDVVVIGAGVAGLYIAYRVAEKGFRVALVESKPREKIGDKACGDAVGLHHFNYLDLAIPSNIIDHSYSGVAVVDPGEKHSIVVPGSGVSINRIGFGQWLLKKAIDNNVELLDKCWFTKVFVKNNIVESIEVRESGSLKPSILEAKVFVDATGAKPSLRTKLPREWPVSERPFTSDFNITYREVIELDNPLELDTRYAYIYLNTEIAPGGYWWLFPKNKNGSVINTGIGVLWSLENANPRILFEKHLRGRFPGRVIHRGGGLVPTRRPLPTLVWRNIVVVGDAAYTVNPVHGGGIGSSLRASHIASKHIVESLEWGEVIEERTWSINREYMASYGAKQASLDILRMFLQKLSNSDYEWIIKNRVVDEKSLYNIGHQGLLSVETVSKIVKYIMLFQKPSLLNKLRIVKKYMDSVERLYLDEYPDNPVKIFNWIRVVEKTIEEYCMSINYLLGERVKW